MARRPRLNLALLGGLVALLVVALWTGTASAHGSVRAGARSLSLPSQEEPETTTTTTSLPAPSGLDGFTAAECSSVFGAVGYASTVGLQASDVLDEEQMALYNLMLAVPAGDPLSICWLAAVQGQVGGGLVAIAASDEEHHDALLSAVQAIDTGGSSGPTGPIEPGPTTLAALLCVVLSLGFLSVRAA